MSVLKTVEITAIAQKCLYSEAFEIRNRFTENKNWFCCCTPESFSDVNKNKLIFNIDKCFSMIYTRKKSCIHFDYSINNTYISVVDKIKDLGILFTCNLSFSLHINSVVASSFKMLGYIIRKTKSFSNINSTTLLFNAYVRSRLEFGLCVVGPCLLILIA